MLEEQERSDWQLLMELARTARRKRASLAPGGDLRSRAEELLVQLRERRDMIWKSSIEDTKFRDNFPKDGSEGEIVDYLYENCVISVDLELDKRLLSLFYILEKSFFNWRKALYEQLSKDEDLDTKLDTKAIAPFDYDEDGSVRAPFGLHSDGRAVAPFGTKSDGTAKAPFGLDAQGLPVVRYGWHDDGLRGRWRMAKGLGRDPESESRRNTVQPNGRIPRRLNEQFEDRATQKGLTPSEALEQAIKAWLENEPK